MYVDASAILAILLREEEAAEFALKIQAAKRRLTCGVGVFEATLGLNRVRRIPIPQAYGVVKRFLSDANIYVVVISQEEAENALRAFQDFGKGSRHPARLNMGDCFAYGCAEFHQEPILFKGDDFVHTPLGQGI